MCISLFQKEQEEKAVKFYYAECLRTLTEGVAHIVGGKYIEVKLKDVLENKPVEQKTAEDIIDGIKNKMK